MLSKKEIKDIQSLSHKKFREALKLFIAEGPKIITEFLAIMPSQIERIYATKEWIETQKLHASVPVTEVKPEELEKISQLQTPHQVLAVIRQFENWKPDNSGFVLYLDTIQDPGNFGTIIRIADWFNIKNIVCSEGCADQYNSKVIQSTMASIARVNIYQDEDGSWLKNQNLPVYAASLHGNSLYQHEKTTKGILIIGNESKGIRADYMALATEKITIPKKGHAESLNAAVATGIILSHLLS